MQCMHAIKIMIPLIIFILCSAQDFAFAASTQVQVGSQVTQTSGQVAFDKSNMKKYSGHATDFQVTSPRLSIGMQITAAVKQFKNDYSNYLLQEESGKQSSLQNTFDQTESQGSVAFDWIRQNHNLTFSHETNVTPTPFPLELTQLAYAIQLNHQLTTLRTKVGRGSLGQPKSYFTDLTTGERKQRATHIELRSYTLSAEQVVNADMRVSAQVELNQKMDRPSSLGILVRSSVALTDRDFLRWDLARHEESRTEKLQDERGYFNLSSGEMMYSRYLTYDLTFSVGYALIVEKEDNPQSFRKDQMVSDVYSLQFGYQATQWTAGLKIQELVSNLDYASSVYGGQFSWNF